MTKCVACSVERDAGARIPRGWHRLSEDVYCASCWTERYVLRAVTMVVASPLDCSWAELYDLAARWQREHARALQHWSDDAKFEQRRPRRRRHQMARGRDYEVEKHHRRIDSFLHQASAWVAAKAARCRVANVALDLAPRGRFASFPWYRLTELVKQKLDAQHIASTPVVAETAPALEQETLK